MVLSRDSSPSALSERYCIPQAYISFFVNSNSGQHDTNAGPASPTPAPSTAASHTSERNGTPLDLLYVDERPESVREGRSPMSPGDNDGDMSEGDDDSDLSEDENNGNPLLQIFISPRWAIWAIHLVAISTILDIVSAVTGKTTSSAYESALLARLAAALLLSSALSRKQLETHKNSGLEPRDQNYVRLLHAFVFANAAAASIQLCGAIIVSSLSLAGRSPSTQLRQSMFMTCTATQLLCHLPFHITRIWRRLVIPISDQIRRLRYLFSHRMTRNDTL